MHPDDFYYDGDTSDYGEDNEPYVVGEVKCVGETRQALQLKSGKGFKANFFWVPKSVVHLESAVHALHDEGELIVMQWFAEKEGL